MKTTLLSLLIAIFTFVNTLSGQVQEWQDVSPFPGAGRDGSVSFVIGETAYVGLGVIYDTYSTYQNDFYKYDVQNDEWTAIADFPGAARASAVAFVANDKAYVGTGYDADNSFADFYEYDPATNSWNPIASIPEARRSASSFTIDNTGYVGLGSGSSSQLSDFYKYDAISDQWTPITGVGVGMERVGAIGFAANGKGYISSGQRFDGGTFVYQDILSYDPNSDTWVEELDYNINLSSLMSNTAYVDEDGLVHVLKSSSSNSEVIINLSDFSVRSEDYYFTDDRDDPIVLYINNEVIAGLGATGNIFDPVYQTSFQKFVTIEPPLPPVLNSAAYESTTAGESIKIKWTNNDTDHDGNLIYAKSEYDTKFQLIDEVAANFTEYSISNNKLSPNNRYLVKVVAHNGLAEAPSNQLSFYSIFRNGRMNTPDIVSITANDSFQMKEMKIINHDLPASVILERRINDSPFSEVDTLGVAEGFSKSTTFSFSDTYFGNANTVDYRIRLFDESGVRSPSFVSEHVSLDLSGLSPSIYDFNVSEVNASDRSFAVKFNAVSFINIDNLIVQHRNFGDSAFINDTIENNDLRIYLEEEMDSIEARVIGSNEFGSDTTDLLPVYTTLLVPYGLEQSYSSVNTIGFSFNNRSRVQDGVLVERSINGGSFESYDSITATSEVYYDENVEEGNSYSYRLFNYNKDVTSKKSSSLTLKASNMGVWKKFNGDGLKTEIDSLVRFSMNYKVFDGGNIYFLSTDSQKLYKYNLDDLTLTSLEDLPDNEYFNIQPPVIHNGKIYIFIRQNANYEIVEDVLVYDIENNIWTTDFTHPFKGYVVNSTTSIDDKLYLTMSSTDSKLAIGSFNSFTSKWNKTDYETNSSTADFVTYKGDSLIIFHGFYDGRTAYHFETKEITIDKEIYGYNSNSSLRFESTAITTYNNELVQFKGDNIYRIDANTAPFLFKGEYFPAAQDKRNSSDPTYAFTYNNKLFYGLSRISVSKSIDGEWNRYISSDLLYFRDNTAPLEPANLKVDSLGITDAKISWIDSPNDDGYYLEFSSYDSIYVTDTLSKDQIQYEVTGLDPDRNWSVKLKAIRDGIEGNPALLSFKTKRGRPYRPKNFESEAVSSSEILYTWDPVDTTEIPVDSLVFIDYNADKYVLNISDTSFLYTGLEENSTPSVDLYVKNIYGSESAWWSNRARTFLNSPFIKNVEIHQTEEYYDLIFEDRSRYENYYMIYRKSADDTSFVKIDSISTEYNTIAEEGLNYEDKNADLSIQYEYYLVAEYQGVDEFTDTTYYYTYVSLPSENYSTENAVLSVNPYLDANISFYPNPTEHEFFIQLESDVVIRRIEVLNVNGSLLKSFEVNTSYPISELNDGLYFIKIYTNQGETTKKLIKR